MTTRVPDHESGQVLRHEGAQIYFATGGDERRPPLLLLHGGFGSLEDFQAVFPGLARDHRLIAIDSRGHGRSTLGPEPLSYARLERDVLAVLARLGLDRVSIVGFSDGGMVGYRLAAHGAIQVDRLVAIGAPHELPEGDPLREKLASITPASWQEKFPESHALYERLNPEPDFDRFIAAVVAMALDGDGYPNDVVDAIRCPLLLVRGDDDPLVSLASQARLRARVEGARFLNIPFASHVAFADQPEIFLQSVRTFLRQPSP